MEIRFKDTSVENCKTDLLVLPVAEKELDLAPIRSLDHRFKGNLKERISKSNFSGAEGSSLLYSTGGAAPAAHLLLVGLGKAGEIDSETWRKAGGRARRDAATLGAEDVAVFFAPAKDAASAAGALVEGTLLASYEFT